MRATDQGSGRLVPIKDCYIKIPNYGTIQLNVLPEISDSKSATYNNDPVIGRSAPLKTFSHSDNRVITMSLHFHTLEDTDSIINLNHIRALQSALYTREASSGAPFIPPPVCAIRCGKLFGEGDLCAVLTNCSVRYGSDVPWDATYETLLPYRVDVDTTWEAVYISSQLPGQERILKEGN